MKQAVLEVLSAGACLYLPGRDAGIFSDDDGDGFRGARVRSLVMIANTRRTLIRVRSIPASWIETDVGCDAEWEMIKELFPFGEKINENTYVFDYTVFENHSGTKIALIVALPVSFSERAVKIGKCITGSASHLVSLDFVENLLIQKFAALSQSGDSFLVLLSQDGGIRLMTVSDGLPGDVFFISNHPAFRMQEFMRFWDDKVSPLLPGLEVVLYTAEADDPENFLWLFDVCDGLGVRIKRNDFSLPLLC